MTKQPKPITIPFTILVSDAEQARYWFTGITADADKNYRPLIINSEVIHLKTGDYTIQGMEELVTVERKSVGDLLQTLADGRDRFRREHERMAQMQCACVMIEGTWPEMLSGTYPHGVSPKVAFRTWLSWSIEFSVPWYAVGPRRLAEVMTFRFLQKFLEKNH
jgi:DNA excision repair protein ERCC-4